MSRMTALGRPFAPDVQYEEIGTFVRTYQMRLVPSQSTCQVVTKPREEYEVSENVFDWIPAEFCDEPTNGLEVWIDGMAVCWGHTPDDVKADIAGVYGTRPAPGHNVGLFNRSRGDGLFGEALRIFIPGKTTPPALVEG